MKSLKRVSYCFRKDEIFGEKNLRSFLQIYMIWSMDEDYDQEFYNR